VSLRWTSRKTYEPKNDIVRTATGSAQSARSSRLPAFKNGLQHATARKLDYEVMNDVPALRPAETDLGALQQMVYRRKISDINQLKHLD